MGYMEFIKRMLNILMLLENYILYIFYISRLYINLNMYVCMHFFLESQPEKVKELRSTN